MCTYAFCGSWVCVGGGCVYECMCICVNSLADTLVAVRDRYFLKNFSEIIPVITDEALSF